jgi:hypothetical protein
MIVIARYVIKTIQQEYTLIQDKNFSLAQYRGGHMAPIQVLLGQVPFNWKNLG